MSGGVIRFDAAAHKVADVLLPWFVNGSLKGDELALVRRHLDECPRCQQEVAWLRDLHAACIAGEATPGASAAFGNLRRQLDAPRQGQVSMESPSGSSGRGRPWWPWATAAQFAVIIALGTLLLAAPQAPAPYRTLGAGDQTRPTTGTLVVVFDPATREAEVQRILRGAGARIVDGPTQANAYVLQVPAGQTERAAQAIRSERAAVLVERLGLQSAR
jgi:anti-sigma factor RsiW